MFLQKFVPFGYLLRSSKPSLFQIKTHQNTFFYKFYTCKSNVNFAKKFIDRENQYAHSILEKKSVYNLCKDIETIINVSELKFSTICDEKDWLLNKSEEDLIESFNEIAHYSHNKNIFISDIRFDKLIDAIVAKCRNFTDEQILDVLKHLNLFSETLTINERNFVEIWSALDDECVNRLPKWDIDNILLVADHWYKLRLAKVCQFTWKMQRKIERKLKKIPPHQLVQLMFYVNLCRKPIIDMFSFEVNLANSIDALTIDEIALMSMGFFKTQTKIKNSAVLLEIYKRTILDISTIKDISLVNILKVLRYSTNPQQMDAIKELLNAVTSEIPRLSLLSCLHIALAGTDIQYCHQDSLELIIKRFISEIKTTRLKDLERMSLAIGLFDFKCKDGSEKLLCKLILEEINEKIHEITIHPKCLPACLHYLTLSGFYSAEFISNALNSKFITHAYGQNYFQCRELLSLDSYTRINLKNSYTGNQLKDDLRKKLAKIYMHHIPSWNTTSNKLSATDKIILEVKDVCDSIYQNSLMLHSLPHFERPDIFMIFNKLTGQTVNLNEFIFERVGGDILTREHILKEQTKNDNLIVTSIVVGGWNHFVREENKPTGVLALKLNQLKIVGHLCILVPWFEWKLLPHVERTNYLKNKVESELKVFS